MKWFFCAAVQMVISFFFLCVTVDIVVGMWIGMTGHMVDVIAARV